MKNITLLILTVILFFGCNNSPNSKSNEMKKNLKESVSETNGLQIQVIENWPDEIDGCSCYSSKSKDEFEKEEYIYMDNYGDLAYMKINGKLERFKLTKSDTLTSSNDSRKTWTNENFEFIIETLQIGRIDETWQHKGKLTLKSNEGEIIETKIYGECGC
ncbi:hypothetical protein [Mariniflexile sp. AS56]|uniref:hypothetical protein n=1 Tax=Mariniflexile sp. AS56 TaxID=3063957 RepID=UPI0026EF31AB|nr:hypothetical protein [Mariniflexile sp. AS56]MDO7174231.1 hypothetical protein [Mariniflexile sp. AS56]